MSTPIESYVDGMLKALQLTEPGGQLERDIVDGGFRHIFKERDALREELDAIADLVGYTKSEGEAYSLAELIEQLANELECHLNLKGKGYTMRQLLIIACNRMYAGKFAGGACTAHGLEPHTQTSNCKDWKAI